MPLKSSGSLTPRTTTTKGKKYTRYYIYLPSDLVDDSQFPFKDEDGNIEKQNIDIEIRDGKLIISESEKN